MKLIQALIALNLAREAGIERIDYLTLRHLRESPSLYCSSSAGTAALVVLVLND